MKTTLALFALAASLSSLLTASYEVSPELKDKIEKSHKNCTEKFPIDDDYVDKVWRREALPQTENDKCYFACTMKHFDIIVDGKYNPTASKKMYEDVKFSPEDVKKGEQIAEKCDTKVGKDFKECQLAYELLKCFHEEENALNMTIPNY